MSIIAIRRDLQAGAVFFRQNGTKLQYSLDSVSWSTAFDFASLSVNAVEAIQNYATWHETMATTYDGTVGSIAPDMVYTATAADNQRDRVMCQAVGLWVDAVTTAATIGDSGLLGGAANILDGAAVFFAGAAAVLLFTPLPVIDEAIAGLIAAIFGGMAWLTRQVAGISEPFEPGAIENVKCCIYNNLAGQTPTLAALTDAIDPDECAFAGAGTDERRALESIGYALQDADTYWSLLSIASIIYDNLKPEAPCKCMDEWVHVIDFTNPNILAQFESYSLGGAAHVPYVGLYRNTRFDANFTFIHETSFTLIGVTAEYDLATGPGASSPYLRVWFDSTSPPAYKVLQHTEIGSGIVWTDWFDAYAVQDHIRLEFRQVSLAYTADVICRRVILYGSGPNPFEAA